jgi:peroxiredoxin
VAISSDPQADSIALRERLGLEYPLLHDAGVGVATAYGVAMRNQSFAVPSVFIVMPDRSIAWKYVGENAGDRPPEDRVLEQLDAALGR